MIRSTDLNEEIEKLELIVEKGSDEKGYLKALVKEGCLLLKVIRDIKTNQVQIMKKMGIELIKNTPVRTEEIKK